MWECQVHILNTFKGVKAPFGGSNVTSNCLDVSRVRQRLRDRSLFAPIGS